MEIITRHQAITQKLNRYFTGVPCKRGHLSERYTQTSNCKECLHPKCTGDPRRDAKQRMERFRAGINVGDLEAFKFIIYAKSAARDIAVQPDDVMFNCKPERRGSDTFLYTFRCFPEDKEALIAIVQDLNWDRLSPRLQQLTLEQMDQRIDGWIPPPLREK